MGARPQKAARIVQLQIEHGGIGQAIGEDLPGRAAIGRAPDADVGADIEMRGIRGIHDDRVVLDVEQASAAPAAGPLRCCHCVPLKCQTCRKSPLPPKVM